LIRFHPLVARNVAEVSWHKTQQTSWNTDGTLDFSARVSGLGEIIWWVLGYGMHAEVIEPQELRDRVREHVGAMYECYCGS
jgi:predicted DNA-binding transcriptional regulator YafY